MHIRKEFCLLPKRSPTIFLVEAAIKGLDLKRFEEKSTTRNKVYDPIICVNFERPPK